MTQRVALITGANRGIGLEIVRQLACCGNLALLGSREAAKGQAAVALLAKEGLEAPCIELDTTDANSIRDAIDGVARRYGRLDILVNNAAILIDGPGGFQASLFELTEDTWRRTFETNVLGPLRLIQAAVPLMRKNNYGRVVNLSSGAGQLADMGMGFPAYRMSKSALNALTRITAVEVSGDNIKVNAVCPGWVRTGMGGTSAERSIEHGAETPVWLATLPDDGPTSGFFRDKKPIPW